MPCLLHTQLAAAELADVIRKELDSQKAEGRSELQVGLLATKIIDHMAKRECFPMPKPVRPFQDALDSVARVTSAVSRQLAAAE